ncbi:MAG: hypothetical protein IKB64_09660 [Paludibacteraceae bacterium]|nr:hypothetical protein [Paludibacteraceae bacterium]
MNEKEKTQFLEEFNTGLHRMGRFLLVSGIIILSMIPFFIGMLYGVTPNMAAFLEGYAKVAIVYLPVSLVEFLVYAPMLGAGGSYISFITGNVTNMKIPVAMNAKEIAGTEVGTPENEIISTLSTATSAIVTTLVIVVGVILLVPLQPVLQNEVLLPAFNNVVPALFGALGLKYFIKSPQIAVIPVLFMILLCTFVSAMINETSTMMVPCGALALLIGYILFKKGKL